MTGESSTNNGFSAIPNRPKVVLVNPNFQRRQPLNQKTIYVNPLFNRPRWAGVQNGEFFPSSSSPSTSLSKDKPSPTLPNWPAITTDSQLPSEPKCKFVTSQSELTSKNDDLKNFPAPKNCSDIAAKMKNFQPPFLQNNQMTLLADKCTYQQNPSHTSQSRKTFINPKFLKLGEEMKHNVKRKASFYYVNAAVLKPEVLKDEIKGLSDSLGFNFVDSKKITINCELPSKSSEVTGEKIAPDPVSASNPSKDVQLEAKTIVDIYPVKNPFSSADLSSTSSVKSAQKKEMNLLKLKKITRLSRMASMLHCRSKNSWTTTPHQVGCTNDVENFAHSNKFSLNLPSVKQVDSMKNASLCTKNNLPKDNVVPDDLDIKRQQFKGAGGNCKINPAQHLQRRHSFLKKLSQIQSGIPESQKHNLSWKRTPVKSRSVCKNIFKFTNRSMSDNKDTISMSQAYLNLKKRAQKNNFEPHSKTTSITNDECSTSTSNFKDDKNANCRKLVYVSNRKLIRKLPAQRISNQINKFLICKNKFSLRAATPPQSKCSPTSSFKIQFKPSRTSSDVINKRLIQRRVINRYKLLNVQQNEVKARKYHSSRASHENLTQNKSKQISSSRVRRQSVIKSSGSSSFLSIGKTKLIRKRSVSSSFVSIGKTKLIRKRSASSSFVSIGKTKLIRKSTLNRKQLGSAGVVTHLESTINKVKSSNRFGPNCRRINLGKFSWKASESGKSMKVVSNDLVAIGRTKLIKQSLLHHQRQANKCSRTLTNVAAASVIQKQLRKLCKALPESNQSKKLLRIVHSSRFKLRNSPVTTVNKHLTRRRIALRRKNNTPCETYHKYGRCKKLLMGKCLKLHDKKYVAICQAYIHGSCKDDKCLLSHDTVPQKMPTCLHFLQGACSRNNCLYPHVKLSSKAPICRDFVRGFCPLGLECDKLHMLLCPELEKNGICSNRTDCKFAHRKKIPRKGAMLDKFSEEKYPSTSAAAAQLSKIENSASVTSKSNDEPAIRYFSTSSGCEFESFIPERPQLGSLPSFIPLSSCDSSEKV